MKTVSVIVPVYHGKKYIKSMIRQVEACQLCAVGQAKIELLFVNDAPDETLGIYGSDAIEIVVLETTENRGIHGARAEGVKRCSGEYILLLDQDDHILPEYIKSQLAAIRGHDAAVCMALHEGKALYNRTLPFEAAASREHMLRRGNAIISPGQVLMRKAAVAALWRETGLQQNGADDWLLWLCMMQEGRSFALNRQILFEHVVERDNTSMRQLQMQRSEWEVFRIIQNSGLFSDEDAAALEQTIQNLMEMRIELLGKFQRISAVYDAWVSLKNRGIHLSCYLRERGCQRVAVYGMTNLGMRLFEELKRDEMEVPCFIDRNAPFLDGPVRVCEPMESLPAVDAVVISLVQQEDKIRKLLRTKLSVPVWTISELVGNAAQIGGAK